jgi:tRNA(Ser,Leu) C12 N-acetylase TAN1
MKRPLSPDFAWNVVVTAQPDGFTRARQLLAPFGTVATTGLYNVLVIEVADPAAFLQAFEQRAAQDPRLLRSIARLVPLQQTFEFSSRATFEEKATQAVLRFADRLGGRTFHVRVKRRGHKGEISGHGEDVVLGTALLDELTRRGETSSIAYDDPDFIVDIEIVGDRAGVSLWSRDDLARFPFLKVK